MDVLRLGRWWGRGGVAGGGEELVVGGFWGGVRLSWGHHGKVGGGKVEWGRVRCCEAAGTGSKERSAAGKTCTEGSDVP